MPAASHLPTAPDGPTGQLATWIAGFTLDQAPPAVQERAKYLLLDGFGCALVGAQLPWTRLAVETITAFEPKGDTPIIGWGATASTTVAAILNAACIRAIELDSGGIATYVHGSSAVIPPVLSLAHRNPKITGAQVLEAAIVGYETGPRASLGLHGGVAVTSRSWHPDPVFGNISCAAVSAKMLGLNAAQVEDALGHGCTQSFGLMGTQFGANSQRILSGWSGRNGLYAAFLAQAGYTGIKQVFELPYGGWLAAFGGGGKTPDPTQISSELGKRWEVKNEGIKPYSCSGALDAGIDALFDVNAKRPLKADEIKSIEFEFSSANLDHVWWTLKRPLAMTQAQMNIAYTAAVAVLDGEVLVAQFAPDRLNADDVWDLIPRITAKRNAEFDKDPDPGHAVQSRVTVRFTDGKELDAYRPAPKAITTPTSNDGIVTKFRDVTDGVIDTDRRAHIEQVVLGLDKEPNLEGLFDLLAPPVKSPFAET